MLLSLCIKAARSERRKHGKGPAAVQQTMVPPEEIACIVEKLSRRVEVKSGFNVISWLRGWMGGWVAAMGWGSVFFSPILRASTKQRQTTGQGIAELLCHGR